jgi:hypothetical protein
LGYTGEANIKTLAHARRFFLRRQLCKAIVVKRKKSADDAIFRCQSAGNLCG